MGSHTIPLEKINYGRIMTYVPYEQMLNGSFIQSSMGVYDFALGGGGILYVLFYFLILAIIQISTESPASTAVFSLISAIAFYALIPVSYHNFFYALTVMATAMTLYKLFMYKRGAVV